MKLRKILLTALIIATVWSCQNESVNDDITTTNTDENKSTVTKNFMGTDIKVTPLGNGVYQNGDMLFLESNFTPNGYDPLKSPSIEGQKLTITGGVRKWSNNTVVYVLQSGISSTVQTEIQKAFNEWTTKTSIKFKQRTTESTYVTIKFDGSTCNCGSANLGANGSSGVINLGTRASANVITHELGHTLGYIHEQNRPDRDTFINVFLDNVLPNGRSQYFISTNSTPLTATVDYNSIMMYKSSTFGNGNGPTMTRKDNGQPVQGFGSTLTSQDIAGTNVAYPGTITPPNDKCQGVAAYVSGRSYPVGSKVTYRGSLFERDFSGWINLGLCGTP
jgi:Astacin (Peptidase family M12A)